MLRIHFTSADVSRISVADGPDPLWEALLSLHLLQERDSSLVFGEWRRLVRKARPARVRLLLELAPPVGYSPDFLTPGRGDGDLGTLVDRMLSTPRRNLRDDLTHLVRERPVTPWTRSLASGDLGALEQLRMAMTTYYETAIGPYLTRMRTQIEADRTRRARALLDGGVDRLLSTLHPSARWDSPVLTVLQYTDQDLYLGGRGLVLLPSLFCRGHPITLKDDGRAPVLVYSITPSLGWLNATDPVAADPVAGLLGPTRATCLRACVQPRTTTDLARHGGISLSAASRQATALREAGLVATFRHRNMAHHQITALGIAVLNSELPV
ncbi:ArsR/SmtB family transcription factor [Actinokineospora iranica]|uniref:Helix-turn-helix domain-containing protein n=1 Tax=Actinokineospora iranica TaxID=1271860 RepID=A0A1G6S9J0_9PSEU|nr:winged helix-turn-helix domain-containing protein [Actinokineospora iranica]SDD12836.1 hypothetical protein SAMN05216174_107272 [Actinokineospora iranica]